MAKSQSDRVEDQIDDLTECSICTEILSEPKVIPCLHTFCFKCLEKFCDGNEPGKSMPCPLCRTDFKIPEGGLSKLKTNFFVEKLIEAGKRLKTLSSSKTDQCACLSGQDLVIFCEDCKVSTCYRCKLKSHKGHNTIDYEVFSSTQREQQIFDDVNEVKAMLSNISSHTMELDENTQKFLNNCKETKDTIEARCSYLKQQIDDQTQILLKELKILETAELEKAEQVKKHHETITDKFQNFLDMFGCLVDRNSESSSLIQLAEDLHSQTEDLSSQFESFKLCQKVNFLHISFEGSDTDVIGIVGEISVHGRSTLEEISQPVSSQNLGIQQSPRDSVPPTSSEFSQSDAPNSLSSDDSAKLLTAWHDEDRDIVGFSDIHVVGLIALGKHLYTAVEDSNEIGVFDRSDFALLKKLPVEQLSDPYDITGCGNFLYISERDDPKIYKFHVTQKKTSTWSVEGSSMALSMTRQQNILATCCEEGESFIVEYSRYGNPFRRIELHSEVRNPKHAIRLSNGNLVVCHGQYRDRLRRVCLIDSDGDVIESFGGRWSTAVGELNEPIRLASYKGSILIADKRNNNVQLLNEDLEFEGELVSNERVHNLHTIFVDNKNDELFIGDYDDPDSDILRYRLLG